MTLTHVIRPVIINTYNNEAAAVHNIILIRELYSFHWKICQYKTSTYFHWSKIYIKPAKIRLLCAMVMCKLCIYTQVNFLVRPRWTSQFCRTKWLRVINIQWWCLNKEGIWDASIQGSFITGHSVGGGAPFTPMKAAQWCFEAKKLDFLAMKIPGLLTEPANFQFSDQPTLMALKQLNRATLLDFHNIIGLNGSNYDSEKSHFALWCWKKMYPSYYSSSFTVVLLFSITTVPSALKRDGYRNDSNKNDRRAALPVGMFSRFVII